MNTGINFPLKKKKYKKAFKVVWHLFTHKIPNETETVFKICLWIHSQWMTAPQHPRQSIISYTESLPDSETEQPPSVCEDSKETSVSRFPYCPSSSSSCKMLPCNTSGNKTPFPPKFANICQAKLQAIPITSKFLHSVQDPKCHALPRDC